MGVIYDSIFSKTNQEAYAKIMVRCPKCKKECYIRAEVGAYLKVIEPNYEGIKCPSCQKLVKMKRVK